MRFPGLLLLAVLAADIGSAQPVVMARTGTLDAAEGDVSLNGQRVLVKFGSAISVAPGESLVTKTGRAEIILGPGAWLRVSPPRFRFDRRCSCRTSVGFRDCRFRNDASHHRGSRRPRNYDFPAGLLPARFQSAANSVW